MAEEATKNGADEASTPGDARRTLKGVFQTMERMNSGLSVSEADRLAAEKFQRDAAQLVATFLGRNEKALLEIRSVLSTAASALGQVIRAAHTVGSAIAPLIVQIVAGMRDMPPRLEQALVTLARRGWYLDNELNFQQLWVLKDWIDSNDIAKVDAYLMGHFERRLDAIEATLVAALPSREKILRSAIGAHRSGAYELSVPVLLTQTDGACIDLTGHHFFQKPRGSQLPEVAVHTASAQGIHKALLSPIEERLPIHASERDRERMAAEQGWANWTELNRHQVLHGESVDYGSRLNSLKAISLIGYLVHFLPGAAESDVLASEELGQLPG